MKWWRKIDESFQNIINLRSPSPNAAADAADAADA
jgi:hypothetical protein